ncbi:hypothetical protein FACS1894151_07200 [Spirochaetia bacterium]|nr:hypothetical protein FACS1894151_07200 [Spirochaetia bacterium]
MIKNRKLTGVAGIVGVLCVIFLCVSCDSLYSERMQKLKEKQPSAGDIAAAFKSTHSAILLKTVDNVTIADESAVDAALTAYNTLSAEVKALLGTEKSLLDSLKTKIDELSAPAMAAAFKVTHSAILLKTMDNVAITDESAVDAALTAYNALSAEAKALLGTEKNLLDFLKAKIDELKASAFKSTHNAILLKTVNNVAITDETAVKTALSAYNSLSAAAKALLGTEKSLLDSLKAKILKRMFITVPGGTVGTGHTWSSTENYPLPVTLGSFKMGAYEVTYDLWYEVYTWATAEDRGGNKYTFVNAGGEGHNGIFGAAPTERKFEPVTAVNWRDIVVWCNAYSEKTEKTAVYKTSGGLVIRSSTGSIENDIIPAVSATGYRLPTEAEWEFAARGGVPAAGTPWTYTYSGSNNVGDVAWTSVNSSNSTHEAGRKEPNRLGLYDMSGNVWELCWDKWSTNEDKQRVRRGGSWSSGDDAVVSFRRSGAIGSGGPGNSDTGFRLVCPPGSE